MALSALCPQQQGPPDYGLGNPKGSSPRPTSIPVFVLEKFTGNFTGSLSIFLLDRQANALLGQREHGSKVMLPENG